MHRVTPQTRVATLLRRFPDAEDILSWYGIDTESSDRVLSLRDLCRSHGMDLEDLLLDIETAMFEAQEDEDDDYDEDDLEDEEEDEGDFAEDDYDETFEEYEEDYEGEDDEEEL